MDSNSRRMLPWNYNEVVNKPEPKALKLCKAEIHRVLPVPANQKSNIKAQDSPIKLFHIPDASLPFGYSPGTCRLLMVATLV